jgi:extracellular elastinolytic metalloproteinase
LTFNGMLRTQPVDCPVGTADVDCHGTPTAGSGGYTYGDFGFVLGFPEVHSDGEIWLQALWDLRQDLGGSTTRELVTRAMELSPPSPSYLDMRNAILQADLVANAGANETAIWSVFAERGMGYFASSFTGHDLSPVEDISTPPDCGTDPCSDISGTVTDAGTGLPLQGTVVSFVGLDTAGFQGGLSAVTDAGGAYSIANVPDHDAYAAVIGSAAGYEQIVRRDFVVAGDATVDFAMNRNWAALGGGATLISFSPPDYSAFCGADGRGAFDGSLFTGWPSDRVGVAFGSNYTGKRRAVVELPETIDATSFAVASGAVCGDSLDAAVKHFQIQTRTAAGSRWRLAVDANAPASGRLRTYLPTGGANNVRFIRFVMITNYGHPFFMDVLEVSVRGS